jgi:cobalamin biosynthesis protein CobT
MLGGAYSFGSGGYHGSPVGELLPVSMELKEEHKKLAVAMAIVVDRSGSMTASVRRSIMELAGAPANLVAESLERVVLSLSIISWGDEGSLKEPPAAR